METQMTRTILASMLLLGAVVNAQADHKVFNWHDTIRPGGHKRGDAAFDADVNYCNGVAGVQSTYVTAAYKACMRGRGYSYQSTKTARDHAPTQTRGGPLYTRNRDGSVTYNRDSPDPNVGWHTRGGVRVCTQDCENDEIPGSGYTCRDVRLFGGARECVSQN
jgi:hypothetical protein